MPEINILVSLEYGAPLIPSPACFVLACAARGALPVAHGRSPRYRRADFLGLTAPLRFSHESGLPLSLARKSLGTLTVRQAV